MQNFSSLAFKGDAVGVVQISKASKRLGYIKRIAKEFRDIHTLKNSLQYFRQVHSRICLHYLETILFNSFKSTRTPSSRRWCSG
jgi:hypothetical protein